MGNTAKMFYDGVENIRLVDGVIHIEFYNIIRTGQTEKREPAYEIVLSQPAFLKAYGAMANMVDQLEKAGLVKRKSPEEAKETPAAGGNSPAGSPNFQ